MLCRGVWVNCPLLPPGGAGVCPPLLFSLSCPLSHSFQLTVEMFDYMDCELKLSESGEPPRRRLGGRVSRTPQGPALGPAASAHLTHRRA